jgi:hypothetical protein
VWTVVVSGKAVSEKDRESIWEVFSTLHKKDLASFNVAISDWEAISLNAVITDLTGTAKLKKELPSFITMKPMKRKKPSQRH